MPSGYGRKGEQQSPVSPLLINKEAIDLKKRELVAGGPAVTRDMNLATRGL